MGVGVGDHSVLATKWFSCLPCADSTQQPIQEAVYYPRLQVRNWCRWAPACVEVVEAGWILASDSRAMLTLLLPSRTRVWEEGAARLGGTGTGGTSTVQCTCQSRAQVRSFLGHQVISAASHLPGRPGEPAVCGFPASKGVPWGDGQKAVISFLGWPCPGACRILVLLTKGTKD